MRASSGRAMFVAKHFSQNYHRCSTASSLVAAGLEARRRFGNVEHNPMTMVLGQLVRVRAFRWQPVAACQPTGAKASRRQTSRRRGAQLRATCPRRPSPWAPLAYERELAHTEAAANQDERREGSGERRGALAAARHRLRIRIRIRILSSAGLVARHWCNKLASVYFRPAKPAAGRTRPQTRPRRSSAASEACSCPCR